MKYSTDDLIHSLTVLFNKVASATLTEWIIFLVIWVVLDFIRIGVRNYWAFKTEIYISNLYDNKLLKYKIKNVISSYGALASLEEINKAIVQVRALEVKLAKDSFDFTEYENIYNKQIDIINERGYL